MHNMEKNLLQNFCRMVSPQLKNFEGLLTTDVSNVSGTTKKRKPVLCI